MAVDYIDFETDSQVLAPTDGVTDCTAAFKKADDVARTRGIRKIKLGNRRYVVSTPATTFGKVIIKPSYARDWLGDWDNTEIFVQANDPMVGQTVSIWQHIGFDNATLIFKIDGNGANQIGTGSLTDASFVGRPTGWHCHGVELISCKHPEVHLKVFNTRSISATGYGSAFAIQSRKGIGGHYWCEFDTDDGSIGSEAIVFHGKTEEPGAQANPWILESVKSTRMWRAMGCYGGGWGVVNSLSAQYLTGPFDSAAPPDAVTGKRRVQGNACNIESGKIGDADGLGNGTKNVEINNARVSHADRFLVVANNYGNVTGQITVNDSWSVQDDQSIVLSGPGATHVDFVNCWFDRPAVKIVAVISGASRANLTFTGCTRSAGSTIGFSPAPAGLTVGTGPSSNSAPSIGAIIPADGATITSSAVIPVEVTVTDDGPFSALTATGQAYLPAVNITSFTVSGTTATVNTDAAHNATTGGAVRVKNMTPGALNAKWTNVTVVDSDTVTFTVPNGTPNGTTYGTLEPVGAAIVMTGYPAEMKLKGTWTAPSADGQVRRLEVTVNDNDASGSLSDMEATTVTTDSLSIDTASPLPGAIIGSSYTATITASGGTGSPTWAVTGLSGHGLSSATVGSDRVISATTITGTDGDTLTFTVSVTKSGVTVSKQFTIAFSAPASTDTDPPDFTEISVGDGEIITSLKRVTVLIADASGLGATPKVRFTSPSGVVTELDLTQG